MPTANIPTWIEQLRRRVIFEPLRADTRTRPLLDQPSRVFNEVIGGGQADFDAPWGELDGDHRALFYAHFNQKGHVEELSSAFEMLFGTSPGLHDPVVLDLGCGPCTGGLALSGVLGSERPFTYIGVDRAASMRKLGDALLTDAKTNGHMSAVTPIWSESVSKVTWTRRLGYEPVIVVCSYLLASQSLDAVALVDEVNDLLARISHGPTTVLYTNAPRAEPNRSFPAFRDALKARGFELVADDRGHITITRGWEDKKRELRYALFHRQQRRVLDL